AVPQREREAEGLVPVGDAGDAVLVPAVGAGARVVVREVLPRGTAVAVVLAHGSPGALAEIGAPALPVLLAAARLAESTFLGIRHGGAKLGDGGAHGVSSCRTWPSGSRTRSGRTVEAGAPAPGRVTKAACPPRSTETRPAPSVDRTRTCQWKRSLPR